MSDVADWWQTSIIDMEPGHISIRGEQIQDLIGNLSFAEMVWLMICGTKPEPGQARLLEAALVGSVDHGPQAPSILFTLPYCLAHAIAKQHSERASEQQNDKVMFSCLSVCLSVCWSACLSVSLSVLRFPVY